MFAFEATSDPSVEVHYSVLNTFLEAMMVEHTVRVRIGPAITGRRFEAVEVTIQFTLRAEIGHTMHTRRSTKLES